VVETTALIDTVSTWSMCTIAIGKITIEQDPILGTNWQRNNIIIMPVGRFTILGVESSKTTNGHDVIIMNLPQIKGLHYPNVVLVS
jgi:hypothetical protein